MCHSKELFHNISFFVCGSAGSSCHSDAGMVLALLWEIMMSRHQISHYRPHKRSDISNNGVTASKINSKFQIEADATLLHKFKLKYLNFSEKCARYNVSLRYLWKRESSRRQLLEEMSKFPELCACLNVDRHTTALVSLVFPEQVQCSNCCSVRQLTFQMFIAAAEHEWVFEVSAPSSISPPDTSMISIQGANISNPLQQREWWDVFAAYYRGLWRLRHVTLAWKVRSINFNH